jgi:hypothetical protein
MAIGSLAWAETLGNIVSCIWFIHSNLEHYRVANLLNFQSTPALNVSFFLQKARKSHLAKVPQVPAEVPTSAMSVCNKAVLACPER